MIYDLVIIGAGPGGLTAGVFARSRKLSTLILEAGATGGQLVTLYPDKGIENYPGCVMTQAAKLAQRLRTHAQSMGCEIHENEKVLDIVDKDGHLAIVSDQGEYEAKGVIIAIGIGLFKPKKLGSPGEEKFTERGVFYKLPDKDRLVNKRVLFVGGGNSALEMALIAKDVAEVSILHRRDKFRADESIVERVQASKIRTIMNAEVEEMVGRDGVEHVYVKAGNPPERIKIDVDMVVINIGFTPEVEYLERWGVDIEENQIKVDPDMGTSRQGVFACGDIVTYKGKYKQIVTACGEAATAANSAYKYIMKPYWA
jgi:ferredoxin/flavodoxin---NADP+ reductase